MYVVHKYARMCSVVYCCNARIHTYTHGLNACAVDCNDTTIIHVIPVQVCAIKVYHISFYPPTLRLSFNLYSAMLPASTTESDSHKASMRYTAVCIIRDVA